MGNVDCHTGIDCLAEYAEDYLMTAPGTPIRRQGYNVSFAFPWKQLLWVSERIAKVCYKHAVKTLVKWESAE